MAMLDQSPPPNNELSPTPKAVPTIDDAMVWDPIFAVTSAKFSLSANTRCRPARLALALRKDMFLPIFAIDATNKKYPGNSGVQSSRSVEASKARAEIMRHRLGLESKRLLTKLANRTPPNWPIPSFMTQLSAAARGMDPAPRPTANNMDCIASTLAAEPVVAAAIWNWT